MPIVAITAAVGSTVSGIAQASAAKSAAKSQTDAANASIDTQQRMFDTTRADLAPFRNGGADAFGNFNALQPFSFNPTQAQLEQTPGYQFTRTQGLKATQNSAAARGLGVSGAALKGAASFATGLANSTFGDNYTRALSTYDTNANKLLAGAQVGEQAAAHTGQFATQTGQNIGATQVGAGQAQAAGQLGVGNAVSNITSGITNALMLPTQAALAKGMYGVHG